LALGLFDQFESPNCLGIPLLAIALTFPWVLYPNPAPRWLTNRMLTLQGWFINRFTQQLFLPMHRWGHKWALMLMTLMLFLLTLNLLGLLPYTFTPTTQLSISLGLAIPIWMAGLLIGLRYQLVVTIAHLVPEGAPLPLVPALILIETISLLIRPLALGVRLMANMTAGHLMIQLVATGVIVLLPLMPVVAILTMVLLFLLTLLEVAVAIIQAYVFVLLLSLYLKEYL
uniref:ATP synthase F0 subunit 6 n=1 Tax=Emmelichthys papillatus TaxID=3139918 RepID=UPI00315D769A